MLVNAERDNVILTFRGRCESQKERGHDPNNLGGH